MSSTLSSKRIPVHIKLRPNWPFTNDLDHKDKRQREDKARSYNVDRASKDLFVLKEGEGVCVQNVKVWARVLSPYQRPRSLRFGCPVVFLPSLPVVVLTRFLCHNPDRKHNIGCTNIVCLEQRVAIKSGQNQNLQATMFQTQACFAAMSLC